MLQNWKTSIIIKHMIVLNFNILKDTFIDQKSGRHWIICHWIKIILVFLKLRHYMNDLFVQLVLQNSVNGIKSLLWPTVNPVLVSPLSAVFPQFHGPMSLSHSNPQRLLFTKEVPSGSELSEEDWADEWYIPVIHSIAGFRVTWGSPWLVLISTKCFGFPE